MKFRVMLMTGLLPLGLGLAGCAAIGEKPESEAAAELLPAAPQPEAKAIASAYVAGLAEAIEQDDFAKGTSSRSTKLVHGGVRYLQHGDVALVFEALRERGRMKANAPHLVKDQAFVISNYRWRDNFLYF